MIGSGVFYGLVFLDLNIFIILLVMLGSSVLWLVC